MNKNSTLPRHFGSKRLIQALFAAVAAILMAGCATANRGDPSLVAAGTAARSDALSVAQVRNEPTSHTQSEVIWGGTIAKIENRDESTVLEIIERPLNEADQPQLRDLSGGRFIATVPGFLDPADFRVGQPVTVDGSIEGVKIGKIGEIAYDFPTVAVNDYQLWLQANNRVTRRSSYYYNPCLLYTSPSPRDKRQSRMPSSA